jgi:hypothetical protein
MSRIPATDVYLRNNEDGGVSVINGSACKQRGWLLLRLRTARAGCGRQDRETLGLETVEAVASGPGGFAHWTGSVRQDE